MEGVGQGEPVVVVLVLPVRSVVANVHGRLALTACSMHERVHEFLPLGYGMSGCIDMSLYL